MSGVDFLRSVCTNTGVGLGWAQVLYGWMMDEGWNCKDVFCMMCLSAMREKYFFVQSPPPFVGRASHI